jgi:hypothetical protein
MNRYSIVCCSHKHDVLVNNLFQSHEIFEHDLHIKNGYTNICKAYNDALKKCYEDIIIFVHQDVYLPETFFKDLEMSLEQLANINWGILGAAGATSNRIIANLIDRNYLLKTYDSLPQEVSTLDELILIIKKQSFNCLYFDENIKNHHLFGTDVCMQSKKNGMKNFVINAQCHHNSSLSYQIPKEYFETETYIKEKWKEFLPIKNTINIIT